MQDKIIGRQVFSISGKVRRLAVRQWLTAVQVLPASFLAIPGTANETLGLVGAAGRGPTRLPSRCA